MRKIVSFMHTSLDGFVAGPNGEMDWINTDESIFDFAAKRTDDADTALYGRVTYQMMEGYWPTAAEKPNASRHDIHHSQWYMKVNKVVLSRTMKDKRIPKTTIISDNVPTQLNKLKQEKGKEIIIFGSPGASHSLMHENLIDEYWLFVNPILLGKGIPLFNNLRASQKLSLVSSQTLNSGVICLNYSVVH